MLEDGAKTRHERLGRRGPPARLHARDDSVRVAEQRLQVSPPGPVSDALGRDRPGPAEQMGRDVEIVDGDLGEPETLRRVEQPGCVRAGPRDEPVAGEGAQGSQPAIRDELTETLVLGPEAQHVGDHQRDAGAVRGRDHAVGLLETHRHRLLAENVLPRARGRDGQLGVKRCRHADADGVDRGRQRVLERRRGAPAPALGNRVRPIRVRVDDEQAGRAQPGPRLGVDPAREAGTDNGDVHGSTGPDEIRPLQRLAYSWYSSGTVSSPP